MVGATETKKFVYIKMHYLHTHTSSLVPRPSFAPWPRSQTALRVRGRERQVKGRGEKSGLPAAGMHDVKMTSTGSYNI